MVPWVHPTQHPKRHLDWFSRFAQLTAERPYTLQRIAPPSPSPEKLPFSMGIWTASNPWFVGLTRFHKPNGILIGSAVFAELTTVTDRPTDIPRCWVCNNRAHLRT